MTIYTVEGFNYNDSMEAIIVAERIWARYDKARDINVYEVNEQGEKTIYLSLPAEKESKAKDTDTEDMFEGDL